MTNDARPGFWSTLPGVLTGIAAVLTAVATLVGALIALGVFDKKDAPSGGTGAVVGSRTPGTGGGSTPEAGNLPPTPAWQGVARLGTFVLDQNGLASLETGTAEDILNVDFAVQLSTDMISLYTTARPSNLTRVDDAPDAASCASTLNERKAKQVNLPIEDAAGQWLCVQTKHDHVGAIRIRSVSSRPREVVIEFVLWQD